MKIETLILKIYATIFVIFALPAFFIPQSFAEILQFNIDLPGAKMEFVAAYGGLILGIGVFLMICIRENPRLGLLAILSVIGTLFIGRVMGYFISYETTLVQNIFLVIEFLTVLLTLKLLRQKKTKLGQRVNSVSGIQINEPDSMAS